MKSGTHQKRIQRHKRVRATITGSSHKPRFSVFRSSKHLFAQLIDDGIAKTIIGLSDASVKGKTKSDRAFELGKTLAKKAVEKNISTVVFDRGGFRYHGRIERIAAGAREGGLQF